MSTKIPSDLSVIILQWKCNTRVLTMPLLKLSDCMGQLVIDAHNINLTFTSPDCYNKVKGENNTSHLCVISTKLFHIFPIQSHYDRWYEVLSLLFFFLTDKTGFKKLGDLPKVTPRSGRVRTFLNPGLGTPNPMFILLPHSSTHYRLTHAFPFQRRQDNQQSEAD